MSLFKNAHALELDWSGQFWSEFNYIKNYSMDSSSQGASVDSARSDKGGYYIRGGGVSDATFQSLFLRLRPKLIVNDNIYIKSEWWVGDPIFGMFGNAVPYSSDQHLFYSNQSRGSSITAQRFWGEFVSDVGTFQVGRVPLHWGLGVVWNSGDNLWDRYMSTGDGVRWIAKFGSFSFIPSFIVNSSGNTVGGSCSVDVNGVCQSGVGSGSVNDYSLILKYENVEDELEGGVNVLKRIGGAGQDAASGTLVPGTNLVAGGLNSITYDLFLKKKFNRLTLSAEVPWTPSGTVGSSNYSSLALATELDWKALDSTHFTLKAGYAPGQASTSTESLGTYGAFYFNPNYHIGMILFNYALANFADPQTLNNPALNPNQLGSPYNNPIVNATYAALGSQYKPSDKWTLKPAVIYAVAPQTAKAGNYFVNTWNKKIFKNNAGADQSSSLGWEFDLGVSFQWDDYFQFTWDNGVFFPGQFFAFSNTAKPNATHPVFGTSLRVGVNF